MAGILESILGSGVKAAGIYDQIGRTEDLGAYTVAQAKNLGNEAIEGTKFTPFTLASNTGNVNVGADGSIQSQLSPEMQAISDKMFGYGQNQFAQANQDPASRQQDLFQQMMDSFAPQQQRADQGVRSGLFSSGRGGMQTAQYGGSPEEFANAKAREEQMLQSYLSAQGLGMQEQMQQANLGGLFMNQGYLPEQNLFNQLNSGIQTSNLAQTGQIAGQNLSTQLGLAGLEGQFAAQNSANQLAGSLFNSAGGFAGQVGAGFDTTKMGTDFKDWVGKLFS